MREAAADPALQRRSASLDPADPGAVRLATAAQVLARLDTPHVPTLRGVRHEADRRVMLQDHVDGRTLAEVLGEGPQTLARLVAIGIALARALHAVHRQQTVHGHLAPEHVLIRDDGSAVLLGFGLAHHRDCPDLMPLADWSSAVLSDYVAPEQLLQVRDDPRSDQWALGALLYQLACGVPPFGPARPGAAAAPGARVWRRRLWQVPPPLRRRRPDLPGWFEDCVHRCLGAVPASRFPNCAAVAWALHQPSSLVRDPRSRIEPGVARRFLRWFACLRDVQGCLGALRAPSAAAPALLVLAIDPDATEGQLPRLLRLAARELLARHPQAHLACLTFAAPAPRPSRCACPAAPIAPADPPAAPIAPTDHPGLPAVAELPAASAGRLALQSVRLWSRGLDVPDARVSVHLCDADLALPQLLDFLAVHQADLLMIGDAAGACGVKGWLALLPELVAGAPCSVHVLRAADASARR